MATLPDNAHSIIPASGYYGPSWIGNTAIPQSFSSAGWTTNARGFVQQTFLGASITNFSMQGGFGDSSSQLTVDLVNDEFNKSDSTGLGLGDDVYHNGMIDEFKPPIVGSPVFFKFGRNFATVQEAYIQTFDDTYGINTLVGQDTDEGSSTIADDNGNITEPQGSTQNQNYEPVEAGIFLLDPTVDLPRTTVLPDNHYVDPATNIIYNYNPVLNSPNRGRKHITFGGILQSFIQNRGQDGNPTYNVKVTDPREILSNTVLLLNNYAGTTYNNSNIINIYGFLEFNPSTTTTTLLAAYPESGVLTKFVASDGSASYLSINPSTKQSVPYFDSYFNPALVKDGVAVGNDPSTQTLPPKFPITGTGFSRRGSQGIPYYRVKQAINALFQFEGDLPIEYKEKSFGGPINFRGYKYVVDLGGLPELPNLYFLDFDQINLLDLCMEICDVSSRELFVSLLPIIDHPSTKFLYSWNQSAMLRNAKDDLIAGIIRVDSIDRSKQPEYGSIKRFIDNLATNGIFVENQDVGYELSNVTTDKFVVGAQEVDMHYFSTNADRDTLEVRKYLNGRPSLINSFSSKQWRLETSLHQQVLPYYGMLGKNAVTIPKGFGAYQQILLDSSHLEANGVGNYYVATEMEMRCALISFERWKDFLMQYNDVYLESVEENDATEAFILENTPISALKKDPRNANDGRGIYLSNNYAVTVPRSLFSSDNDDLPYGKDGLPRSPCNPPYGYPLYYKRATKIGIAEAGLTNLMYDLNSRIIPSLAKIKNIKDKEEFKAALASEWLSDSVGYGDLGSSTAINEIIDYIYNQLQINRDSPLEDVIGLIETHITHVIKTINPVKLSKQATENATRVYNFIKGIAEECLGKKFLVKIPKRVNLWYDTNLAGYNDINQYVYGPFGFKPRPANSGIGYEFSSAFFNEKKEDRSAVESTFSSLANPKIYSVRNPTHPFDIFLDSGNIDLSKYEGELNVNFNPISDQYEFNYEPVEHGGYFQFDLLSNISPQINGDRYNLSSTGVRQLLVPQDLTNFTNENGRVSAYVRFDHSEFLSMDQLAKDSFSQQVIDTVNGMIPDVSDSLDNTNPENNKFHHFPLPEDRQNSDDPNNQDEKLKPQVAFVKCQVDTKFYMPPKTVKRPTVVFGRGIKDIGKFSKPKKIYVPETDSYVDSIPYYRAQFIPDPESLSFDYVETLDFIRRGDVPANLTLNNDITSTGTVSARLEDLDTNNVYALITLPGRIVPTYDSRFRDGPFQNMKANSIKHFLGMDVVKGLPEFEDPPYRTVPLKADNIETTINQYARIATSGVVENARKIYEKVLGSLSYAFPQQVNLTMPSPVYPDLVALPLMSKERCYGPWISSQIDDNAAVYSNIGGRIEFVKDENLAPWNYAGYAGMDIAGRLQAEFSNSLLLFSERGGFVVPDVPEGVSLCKQLTTGGPLVTNISVAVGDGGIKTTYQLDLYTSSFGKLQKQKQDHISKISREKQKSMDEKNALIRKNLGKAQKSVNYQMIYNTFGSMIAPLSNALSTVDSLKPPASQVVATVKRADEVTYSSETANNETLDRRFSTEMSMQTPASIALAGQSFPSQTQAAQSYYNSAGGSMSDTQAPASLDFYHPNMSHSHTSFAKASIELYKTNDSAGVLNNPQNNITLYEV